MAEFLTVIELRVAPSQGVDPLSNQLVHGVIDEFRIAMIREAGGEPAENPGAPFDLFEQQTAPIGTDCSPRQIAR